MIHAGPTPVADLMKDSFHHHFFFGRSVRRSNATNSTTTYERLKDILNRTMAVERIRNGGATALKETKRRSKAEKSVDSTEKQQQKVSSEETSNEKSNHSHNTNEEHLPPILLTLVVFTCSSIFLILCLRDFWMTGKNIFGHHDDMFMVRRREISCAGCVVGCKTTFLIINITNKYM